MGLELKRKKDHSLRSKWWYGRYSINGKRHFINLGVEIKGSIPASLRKTGDKAFEHSRLKAQVKLDGLISEARSQKNAEKHLEELYELKSGSSIEQIPLADIESCWLNLPSRKRRTELWEKNQCTTLRKFRDGQDNMAVNDAGQHASANEIRPLFGMHLGAGEAEGGLATEGNAVGFTTMGAAVLREPHLLWIAATEHFLDDFIVVSGAVVRAVRRRECVPVVTEDLLEGVLVDAGFHSQVS